VPNSSQHLSEDSEPCTIPPERTATGLRLDNALLVLPSRYASGHEASMAEVNKAVSAVVDEMRREGMGSVEVLLAIKFQLSDHPATASVHGTVIGWCIERYYQPIRAD
jgi:hypothetical protein